MKLNTKAERLAFILRGGNRRKIYWLLLRGPRTIASISVQLGISLSNVSRTVKDFEKHALVNNVTPTQLKGCIYQLTPIALEIKSEFEEHCKFLTEN